MTLQRCKSVPLSDDDSRWRSDTTMFDRWKFVYNTDRSS